MNMSQFFFEANNQHYQAYLNVSISLNPSLVKISNTVRDLSERLVALVLFLLCSPLFLFCTLLVRFSSRGPAIYKQLRVGEKGQLFTIYKFRSMVQNAEKDSGPVLSRCKDPRVTPIGKFLRNSHLDELPQLLNVLRGEMSFIGPRPERPEFVSRFCESIPKFSLRTNVKPGITGLAQICGSYEIPPEEKLAYDLAYLERRNSIRLNVFILLCTIRKILHVRYNV